MKKLIFTLTTLITLYGCHQQDKQVSIPTSSADSSSSFRTDTVRFINPEEEIRLNGEVSFDQDSVVNVFPLVSGNVEKVNFTLGTYVQKGQVLATIRSGDITNYVNDYQADKANLELAEKTLQNTEALYKSNFASETDYLGAKKSYEKAKEELSRSSQILQIYGGGTQQAGQPYFSVKAPISGYIVAKNINTGMQLRADNADPLFTISNLRKVWVMANVYETDIPTVKQGQEVSVNVLSYPDRTFKGKVDNINSVLDNQTRVLKVRIVLDNQEGLLKPDMFATIHVHLPQESGKMLAVPPKAVVFDGDRYFVVVQTGRDKYDLREVKVVKNSSRYVFVEGPLKPGEMVVTEGSLLLYNDLNA